jgi:DNA-binding SARP family transcriptional activator
MRSTDATCHYALALVNIGESSKASIIRVRQAKRRGHEADWGQYELQPVGKLDKSDFVDFKCDCSGTLDKCPLVVVAPQKFSTILLQKKIKRTVRKTTIAPAGIPAGRQWLIRLERFTMAFNIRLFGAFAVHCDGAALKVNLRGSTLEILCFLLANAGKGIRREKLAAMFWPDRPDISAGHLLGTSLWRIRKIVSAWPMISMTSEAGIIRIDLAGPQVTDAGSLSQAVGAALNDISAAAPAQLGGAARRMLLAAVGEQDSEFLEGQSHDWVHAERERYFHLRIRALTLLLNDAAESRRFEAALAMGRRVTALDPFHECAQRQVMWLYLEAGQRARALRQYSQYEKLLRDEMGLRPMAETTALRDLIAAEGSLDPANGLAPVRSRADGMREIMQNRVIERQSVFAALSPSAE